MSQAYSLPGICHDKRVPYSLRDVVTKLHESQVKNVITMVGAGISTAAGIPDFRSTKYGIFSEEKFKEYKLPSFQTIFESNYFDQNPEPLFTVLKDSMLCKEFKPTKAHYFVKLLEEKGVLRRHYSQNIDGLDRLAGIASDKLIEAHGTLRTSHCTRCQKEYTVSWLRDEVNSYLLPKCTHCGGLVKPDIVLFGDPLPDNFREKIITDYPICDLLIVMGTSLVVEPFASLITNVPSNCLRVFINKMPLGDRLGRPNGDRFQIPGREIWLEGGSRDTIMHGECDDCVEELARMIGWQSELSEITQEGNSNQCKY